MKFRKLKANEIDVRVGNVYSYGYSLLLYKDARCDMNILDETIGSENWQRDHKEVKGNLYCGVGINQPLIIDEKVIDRWVWKWDCGTESNTEKEKGEASDSFKRACVNWGIGRELYTSPRITVKCEMTEEKINNKSVYKIPYEESKRKFKVNRIEYNENGEISYIEIVDNKGVQVPINQSENQTEKIIGGEYVLQGGKYNGATINEVLENDQDYIRWCILNAKNMNVKKNMEKAWLDKGLEPITVEV